MARHVEDLALAMRVLTGADSGSADSRSADATDGFEFSSRGKSGWIDTDVPPVAWRDPADVEVGSLRVAYWTEDGYFPAAPAARRAVVEAAAAVRSHGATVEPFDPPDVGEAMRLYFGLTGADGGRGIRELLGSSRVDWRLRRLLRWARLPRSLRPMVCSLLELIGEGRTAQLVRAAGAISARTYWRLVAERQRYLRQFLNRMRLGRFDAILTPPYATAAVPHGSSLVMLPAASYALLPNLLDLPAGVVAATRVREHEESDRPARRDRCDRAAIAAERSSVGLPMGVQVIGLPWREDLVLALMAALESHFRTQPGYPLQPGI
jgi:fatty acid amide hydrolase